MLVLSRKKGEVVTIGKSVTVQIINIERGVVSLGIVAPKNIPVHRKEISDAIIEQNKQAIKATNIQDLKQTISHLKIKN